MSALVYNGALLGGLLLFFLAELRSEGFRKGVYDPENPSRHRRNWTFLAAALIAGHAVQVIGVGLREVLPPLCDWSGLLAFEVVSCFLVAELFGWAVHYVKHQYEWLWRFHFQHHRESNFDAWLVTHTHAVEVVFSGTLMSVVLIGLGFSVSVVQGYLLFYTLANCYQHSSFDLTLGWLDRLIVNPAYHRYHHGVGSGCNYGNTLTLWDIAFRTARWPAESAAPDVEIGIGDGPEPYGFLPEMLYCLEPGPDVPPPAAVPTGRRRQLEA